MSPDPTPTPGPVLSLPLDTVTLGLLVFVGGAMLLVFLLARHRYRAAVPGVSSVPWLASLLDGLPQPALVVDASGYPVAWSATAARALSLTDQARELPLSLATLVVRVLDMGTTETIAFITPEAPDRRLQVTASPLGRMDHPVGVLVLIQDPATTTGGAVAYRHLVGAIAHELRTPLTAILGHTDILDSCMLEEEALWRRSRDYIVSETQRLARLVEDLLTLSRLDLTPLQRQPVNLRAVAEEAISALFQSAEERGVWLSLQSPSSLPRIPGDRDRLQQVFLDLLDNAVKYSPSGGEVVVRLSLEGDFVQVEVQDDGVGIASEDLPHVFDPLYRGERARDVPGTGLGLTIVRTILEQHNATIEVQSTPHHGTIFRFRLPHAQSSQASPTNSS